MDREQFVILPNGIRLRLSSVKAYKVEHTHKEEIKFICFYTEGSEKDEEFCSILYTPEDLRKLDQIFKAKDLDFL